MAQNQSNLPVQQINEHPIVKYIEQRKDDLLAIMPKTLTPEKMMKFAINSLQRTPKLMQCSIESVYMAFAECLRCGFEPGVFGKAHLVPFFNGRTRKYEAQFILGYTGMIQLARNSGEITTIEAHLVYGRDKFQYKVGEIPHHEPCFDDDRGKIRLGWAYAKFKDGSYQVAIMSLSEINGIMNRSKSKDKNGRLVGPWVTDYPEMAKKTLIRRLSKYLPLTIEAQQAIMRDDEKMYDFRQANVLDDLPTNDTVGTDKAKEILKKKRAEMAKKKDDEVTGAEPPEGLFDNFINEKQVKKLCATYTKTGIDEKTVKAFLEKQYGIASRKDIKKEWFDDILAWCADEANAGLDPADVF